MLKHKGTRTIQTERLILRRYTPDDAKQVLENWAGDPEVCKFLRGGPNTSLKKTRENLEKIVASYEQPDRYRWVLTLKPELIPIGSVSLTVASEADELGELGYCLGRAWWGKGLMTEAVKAVLAFGFEQVGFNRIEACHSINNPASGRVLQKAGMLQEGLLRQSYKCSLGFQDSFIYGILRQDYLAGAQREMKMGSD